MGGAAVFGRCCWLLLQEASPAQSVLTRRCIYVAGALCLCCSCVWQICWVVCCVLVCLLVSDWVRVLHLEVGRTFIYALFSCSCNELRILFVFGPGISCVIAAYQRNWQGRQGT